MELFAALLDQLVTTPARSRKIELIARYLAAAPDPDRGYALACLSDGVPLKISWRRPLAELVAERTDPVLYELSRDYIGDTAETVALLWPERGEDSGATAPRLGEVIAAFRAAPRAGHAGLMAGFLDRLDVRGRWAFLKLIGGAPRAGVSARLAKVALAAWADRDVAGIEEVWHALEPPYVELFAWLEGRAERPDPGLQAVFRPVMLAHPIEEADWAGIEPSQYAAEWKWDGIRVQASARGGDVRLFSRAGDDISAAFPEIASALTGHNVVADGELLIMREGVVAPFNDLQQRLNRKTVTARMLKEHPAHVRLYDLLIEGEDDLRPLPFLERRRRLVAWHGAARPRLTDISELVAFETRADLDALRAGARAGAIEGLMLKRRDGPYLAGRVKGQWWKWKRAALTLDCVLMYAERGSGKRASLYSDYTFGVWRQPADHTARPELVPVGKAYSGFTDDELRAIDQWVKENTIDRFGPVRAVAPGLVLEVAFDAVHRSARHKSGVAMRFPRIARIRWDKPAAEADTLTTVMGLISNPIATSGA